MEDDGLPDTTREPTGPPGRRSINCSHSLIGRGDGLSRITRICGFDSLSESTSPLHHGTTSKVWSVTRLDRE